MVVHIHGGKGRKDRDVMLSPRLLDALRAYWRSKRPRVYLFPSSNGHRGIEQPISDKTIWNVRTQAIKIFGNCESFRQFLILGDVADLILS